MQSTHINSARSALNNSLQQFPKAINSVRADESAGKGLCLIVENSNATAVISLFGAHLLSYINKADNKERLWLSEAAIFDNKTPIRGGIPLCWPWFSSHAVHAEYPSHGYARTQMFTLVDISETHDGNNITSSVVTLKPSNPKQFAYTLDMSIVITVSGALTVEIQSHNQGTSAVALTQALHTYLRVDDISLIQLHGVKTPYADKLNATTQNKAPQPYLFNQEVDRIHDFAHNKQTCLQKITLTQYHPNDKPSATTIRAIEQQGHDSTVVWNPWKDKSVSMKDMHQDGYKTMLCIEAANTTGAQEPLILAPEQTHNLSQTIF